MNKLFKILLLLTILSTQASFVFAAAAPDCDTYCQNTSAWDPPEGEFCLCAISATSVEAIVGRITNWVFYIGIILAPLMIIIGAFMFLTSAGEPDKVRRAKKLIIWTIIGLAVILFSKGLISLIKYILLGT